MSTPSDTLVQARSNPAAVSSAGSLSACLSEAIRSPMVTVVGGTPEGFDAPVHGADLREGRWEPPATITADMVVEANRWRQQHDQRSGWVQQGVLKQWLAIVITGSARRPGDDVDEAARLSALMFAVEEHPAFCFTKGTLRDAQRRFKFLPTPAELLAFADAIVTAETGKADRLWKIVEAGVRTGAAGVDNGDLSTRLNREAGDRERRELAAVVEAKYGKQTPTPARLPDESANDYAHRLRLHMDAELDRATKQMRGGMRPARPKTDKPVPPPTPEQMQEAAAEFRKVHEHGPQPAEAGAGP
jgi:hypothetical protein